MTSSSPLFLISGALLISLAVLCHGEPVLDADGNEVQLGLSGRYYTIHNAAVGSRGALGVYLNPFPCNGYLYEARHGIGMRMDSTSPSQDPVMRLGRRYKFTVNPWFCLCDPIWSIGRSETNGDISYLPIRAGELYHTRKLSWFEARATEEKGIYKLAACSCEACENDCSEIGTFFDDVQGRTVLGIGGERFTVRFHNYTLPLNKHAVQ